VNRFPLVVAYKTMNLLIERKAILYAGRKAYWVWPLADRVLVIFDPEMVDIGKLNEDFAHKLSTRLNGRLVVRTNSRGLFLQVDPQIPPAPFLLENKPLDLSLQSTPVHVPVGMTDSGPLWIPFTEGDSYLVGGSRGGGKTGLEHAWIQALLHGGQILIYAWDGKRGAEFGRYAGNENFKLLFRGLKDLQDLEATLRERERLLTESGYPNILLYNEFQKDEPALLPIALFVDEAADLPDQAKDLLKGMIRLYRHVGLYPVIATNQPTQAEVFAKTNLSTRVAFRVPHHNDSITMLGYKGAESLPDVRGRGLIVWKGRFVQFQSFQVTYPMPSEETRQLLANQLPAGNDAPAGDEITQLAESIRSQWHSSMSKRQVGRLLGKEYAGAWTLKIDRVIQHLGATTTETTYLPAIRGAGA